MSTKPKGIDWDAQPLGKMADTQLARQLGVSHRAVAGARYRRGIPSFKGLKGDRDLARQIMNARPMARSTPLTIPEFALLLFVGKGTVLFPDVKEGLEISSSSTSELLKNAEKKKLVRLLRVRTNRPGAEVVAISLTPKGLRTIGRRRKNRFAKTKTKTKKKKGTHNDTSNRSRPQHNHPGREGAASVASRSRATSSNHGGEQ